MKIDVFFFSGLTASRVHFDPGDQHFIQPMTDEKPCFGVLFLSGSWRLHNSGTESGQDVLGWHTPNKDGTWPTEFWNSYGKDDHCEGGPEGVDWVCAEQNDTGSKNVTHAESPSVLPEGRGMLVCSGLLDVGETDLMAPEPVPSKTFTGPGKIINLYQDPIEFTACKGVSWGYFPPSDIDRPISGTGKVLLVN